MNCKKENLARIYYAVEHAYEVLTEGVELFGSVEGYEFIEYELEKINRLMEIVQEDTLHLLESESE